MVKNLLLTSVTLSSISCHTVVMQFSGTHFVSPNKNTTTNNAILFILLFFSRDRNYGIPQGPFTHMHQLLYSCWVFLQSFLVQFSVLRFLPIQTFMVYMKQQLHQLVPKTSPRQVICHTSDRRNTSF